MKNYLLLFCVVLVSFSCSKEKKTEGQKAQESIKTYVKNKVAEADTYEAIAFGKLDSLTLGDTEVYKKAQQEKMRLESSINSLKGRMKSMEQTGVQKTDRLYTELKEKLDDEEKKMKELEGKLKKIEDRSKERVYSMEHKYQARKKENSAVMTYDEIFIVDENGNIIEDIIIYEY